MVVYYIVDTNNFRHNQYVCYNLFIIFVIDKNMKNFLNKLLKPKIEVPVPERFPSFNNIRQWMDEKIAYYEKVMPEDMANLFNPSSGDYIPLGVIVGTSEIRLKEHIEYYRSIKKHFPEAVEKSKQEYLSYSYYRFGDPEDYPQE